MPYDNMITRADADALIPVEVTRDIIKSLPAQSASFSLMRRATMSSKQQRMPVLSALAQAYWVGGDTGLKQTTKQAWGNKYLVAEELAAIIPIPQAVLDDADYDIWGEVRPSLEEAAGALIDLATIFGVGTPASWPTAIIPGADAAGNEIVQGAVGGRDVAGDVNALMGLLEADGIAINGFAGAPTLKATFRGLRDSTGQPIFVPSLTQGAPNTLFGEPFTYVDNGSWDSSTGTGAALVAGNWRNAIVAVRQDFTYTIHKDGVISDDDGNIILNLMQQDAVAMRMVMRVGFQVANPISRLAPNEATRYPFGVLRPTGYVGP